MREMHCYGCSQLFVGIWKLFALHNQSMARESHFVWVSWMKEQLFMSNPSIRVTSKKKKVVHRQWSKWLWRPDGLSVTLPLKKGHHLWRHECTKTLQSLCWCKYVWIEHRVALWNGAVMVEKWWKRIVWLHTQSGMEHDPIIVRWVMCWANKHCAVLQAHLSRVCSHTRTP